MQLVGACPCVPGLPPTAPAQGKQPLSQDLQEAQSSPTWKPSEQLAGRRAPSREEEAAQPRFAQALLGWNRVRFQDGRAPALLRGPICRVAGARLLCPGRALRRLASLQGFLPRKEPAARGWDSALAPSWPQLRSCLALAPRPQAYFGSAQGSAACTLPRAPAGRALCEGREVLVQGSSSGC